MIRLAKRNIGEFAPRFTDSGRQIQYGANLGFDVALVTKNAVKLTFTGDVVYAVPKPRAAVQFTSANGLQNASNHAQWLVCKPLILNAEFSIIAHNVYYVK